MEIWVSLGWEVGESELGSKDFGVISHGTSWDH